MKELKVHFGGNTSGYDAAVSRMRRKANEFAADVSGKFTGGFSGMVGGLIGAGALSALTRATIGYADEIEETSSRIGVSIGKLQEWRYAAEQSGASVQSLTMFIEQLADAASDPKNSKKFSRMGITPEGMTPEALFQAVSSFARKNSSTEVRAALDGIVQARSLGRMMNLLQSDLDALGKSARDAGAVMRDELTHQLATLNDQFSVLSQILYTQFGPAILEVAKVLLRTTGAIGGVAAEGGAKTAGVPIPMLLAAAAGNPAAIIAAMRKMATDPNQKIYNETGEQLFAQKVTSIDDLLKTLANWKPQELPAIAVNAVEKEKRQRADKAMEADALAKVGGFTASTVLFNPALNVAQDQLKELREINRTLKTGAGGINSYFQ